MTLFWYFILCIFWSIIYLISKWFNLSYHFIISLFASSLWFHFFFLNFYCLLFFNDRFSFSALFTTFYLLFLDFFSFLCFCFFLGLFGFFSRGFWFLLGLFNFFFSFFARSTFRPALSFVFLEFLFFILFLLLLLDFFLFHLLLFFLLLLNFPFLLFLLLFLLPFFFSGLSLSSYFVLSLFSSCFLSNSSSLGSFSLNLSNSL